MDLPYRAEYAKSNRASCRGCKSPIGKDTLRLAVMVQSPMYDGKTPNWYHHACFFKKQRPKTVDDIEHYEALRWEDQETIKTHIQSASAAVVPEKKGKKRDAATAAASKTALKDFVIEYSKSGRATCRGCEQKILKDEIRVSKKDFETDVGKRYGGQDMWHHLACFAQLRSELGYFESADKLPGYKSLNKNDQAEAKKQLPAVKQEDVAVKKVKTEDVTNGTDDKLEKKMKSQNKLLYRYRDKLKELKLPELKLLLSENDQDEPSGKEEILDRVCDIMAFGALEPCDVCKGGQLSLDKLGYKCHGNLTEWTKCDFVTKEPKRRSFVVPDSLKTKYSFLEKYKYTPGTRLIKDSRPTVSNTVVKKEENEENRLPKVQRERAPLCDMEFVIIGKMNKNDLKKQITSLGGKVTTKITDAVMAVISTQEEVEKMGARITEAKDADIQVVPLEFLNQAKDYSGRIPELILKLSICSWGTDPHARLPAEPSSASRSQFKSGSLQYKSSKPSVVKLKLKDGGAVDPDSGLEDCAHIYQSHNKKYSVVLGLTDIQKKKNSYYKLQLLEADRGHKYWLFRSWGRIGTTIGSNKLEEMDLHKAKDDFCALYKEKTGNSWKSKDEFIKVPGRMYPIDIDYGDDDDIGVKLNSNSDSVSKLKKPIQELIELIFDVNQMKKVMLEFELDTEKMPLGKLSKAQLASAYSVLAELQRLIETGGSQSQFIDASNRFYTFVPHSFGIENPPIIDDPEMIKKKIEMIDNLMELEIAYNLMKSTEGNNSVDAHYDKLNAEIDTLDPTADEYSILKEYVKNTHAATHTNYELELLDIFTVKRQGEEKRYKPFKKLPNRKLLWHGSRTTNFAGILSQGLRIAPPEAPVTGYMFGKGIYFADMVSKSANYCCTNVKDNIGLLLLCEVALGEMYELENAKYVEKLPKGKHSVKGIGRTEPDPEQTKEIKGVHVPLGKGILMDKSSKATSLLYNEYIVYDVAQVNIKYLLKMNFKHKY